MGDVYVNKLSAFVGTAEYHVLQPLYESPTTGTSLLWQVDVFGDKIVLMDDGEFTWFGSYVSELIERNSDGNKPDCITNYYPASAWTEDSENGTAGEEASYGTDDHHCVNASSALAFRVTSAGTVGDFVTIDVVAEEGDCIDISLQGYSKAYQSTDRLEIWKDGEKLAAPTGRGYDSQLLTAISVSSTPLGSRTAVRPWDSNGDMVPFDWRYNENHRLEVMRNCEAGTYTIRLTQMTADDTYGLRWGRVLVRKPSSGLLDPTDVNVVPRFAEYDIYRSAGHYIRMLSLAEDGSMDNATKLQVAVVGTEAEDFFGGSAHASNTEDPDKQTADLYDSTATFEVKTVGDYGDASWDAGFNGPYTGVRVTVTETVNLSAPRPETTYVRAADDITTQLVHVMSDGKRLVTTTQTFSPDDDADYGVYASYLGGFSITRDNRRPLAGDGSTRPYDITHYEFRDAGTAGTTMAVLGGEDENHDEEYCFYKMSDIYDGIERVLVHRILSVTGGNYDTNGKRRWVNSSGKLYVTALRDIDVPDGTVVTVMFETFYADPDFLDAEAPSEEEATSDVVATISQEADVEGTTLTISDSGQSETHYQIVRIAQSFNDSNVDISSRSDILLNGNVLSLSAQQMRIILDYGKQYKFRFRTKTAGVWSDWSTPQVIAVRNKDYKYEIEADVTNTETDSGATVVNNTRPSDVVEEQNTDAGATVTTQPPRGVDVTFTSRGATVNNE